MESENLQRTFYKYLKQQIGINDPLEYARNIKTVDETVVFLNKIRSEGRFKIVLKSTDEDLIKLQVMYSKWVAVEFAGLVYRECRSNLNDSEWDLVVDQLI